MATTTNYGWTTPDDTALVKDGAAAIRSLGTAIDTTTYNNAQAAIAKTIVDAKGDIIAATAADTVARLAVGSNNQVLTADNSTSTGLKWATPAAGGGMTLLSTTSLSGNAVNITGISTSYKDLRILIKDITFNSDEGGLRMRLNNGSTSNSYQTIYYAGYASGTVAGLACQSDTSFFPFRITPYSSAINAFFVIDIADYANSTTNKTISSIAAWNEYGFTTGGEKTISVSHGGWFETPAAINEVNLFMTASKTFSSGTVEIYGVN